jgi:nitrogenase molybdenum-iron protein alpha chain
MNDPASPTPDSAKVRDELLKLYSPKTAKKRAKHIQVNDPDNMPEIEANVRTIPGVITQRGCTYAGCKGVVLGPIQDIVHIVHGPIGCSFYAWLSRRNQASNKPGVQQFIPYAFSTDMQEEQIVFGGEKKLKQACREAFELFKPKAIALFSTCPVGLIGDDVHAVAREMKAELGINVFGFSCEGYKGVSQSAGHHIANNGLFKNVIGTKEDNQEIVEHPFTINILGEYNIGGDAFEIERILEKCGIRLVATLSGNVKYDDIAEAHLAKLNVVMCHRSINYIGEMMEKKFGIPWFKVSFIGADSTAKSLRKIAKYFGNADLIARVEAVIAEEMAQLAEIKAAVKSRLTGKVAMLFVGGSRAHHYQDLLKEVGMNCVAAGYEFAHRDDYEGRRVIPTIKIDADSRNIEELHVDQDPERFAPRKTEAEKAALIESGFSFSDYDGMMSEMKKGQLVVDDISHKEMEKLIEFYHPDLFCSGIKDKFVIEKMGIPCKQLHSYDYGGPYAGFLGASNFWRDIDRMVGKTAWKLVTPPWKKTA